MNGAEKNDGHEHIQLSSFIDDDIIALVVDTSWCYMQNPQIKVRRLGTSHMNLFGFFKLHLKVAGNRSSDEF